MPEVPLPLLIKSLPCWTGTPFGVPLEGGLSNEIWIMQAGRLQRHLGSLETYLRTSPASTKALYFVARGNGAHQFSSSLAEHNQAVNKYQRK